MMRWRWSQLGASTVLGQKREAVTSMGFQRRDWTFDITQGGWSGEVELLVPRGWDRDKQPGSDVQSQES